MEGDGLVLKVAFNGDLRRVKIFLERFTWKGFTSELAERFHISEDQDVKLQYISSLDSSLKFVSNENELKELFNSRTPSPTSSFRFDLVLVPKEKAPLEPLNSLIQDLEQVQLKDDEEFGTQQKGPIHEGVICSHCNNQIYGIRYKCGHCAKFDLCENCETIENPHDPHHILLKIKIPVEQPSYSKATPLLPPAYKQDNIKPKYQLTTPAPLTASELLGTSKMPGEESSQPLFESSFVEDVTIPQGTTLGPNACFLKKWLVKNTGEQKWPSPTRLNLIQGEKMGSLVSFLVPSASQGATVEVSISLRAPTSPGTYKSIWSLVSPSKEPFGEPLICEIIVEEAPGRSGSFSSLLSSSPPLSSLSSSIPLNPSSLEYPDDNRYDEEMKKLLQQGFADRKRNFSLLKQFKGDLQSVVEQLLKEQENDWFARR